MDPISQERFDTLRNTDQANWTEADFGFMRARRGYLTTDEVTYLCLDETAVVGPSDAFNTNTTSEPAATPVATAKAKKPATK
jgi:hypothetical protein